MENGKRLAFSLAETWSNFGNDRLHERRAWTLGEAIFVLPSAAAVELDDAFDDAAGELVAVGTLHGLVALSGVAEEAAFYEDSGVVAVAEDVVAGMFDAAVAGADLAVHTSVAGLSEGFAFAGVVEGLEALDVLFPS